MAETVAARLIYMSCEVQKRELEPRLYTAAQAAGRGYVSLIGHKNIFALGLNKLPPGIFWHKSVTTVCKGYYALCRRTGHATVGSCEELINLDLTDTCRDYARLYFSRETADLLDIHLSSSRIDSEIAHAFGVRRIADVGNVRIELLGEAGQALHAPRADRLRRELGRFFLVNSPFGLLTSLNAKEVERELYDDLAAPQGELEQDYFEKRVTEEKEGIATLVTLVTQLHRLGRVVVRPHPHENPEIWRRFFGAMPNVFVRSEGPITPWLLAAEAVFQGNCTTGLECLLLGRPVTNFMTTPDHTLSARLIPPMQAVGGVIRMLEETGPALTTLRGVLHGVGRPVAAETLDLFDTLPVAPVTHAELTAPGRIRGWHPIGRSLSMQHRWPLLDAAACVRVVDVARAIVGTEAVTVSLAPNLLMVAPPSFLPQAA